MTSCKQELIVGSDTTPDTPESSSSLTPTQEEDTKDLYLDMEPLSRIANGSRVTVPRNPHFTRKDVVNAFQQAFELVGGIPRLALWANENQGEFYKLYARLLPSQASTALGESNRMEIVVNVPESKLDE